MSSCESIREQFSAYLDGNLTGVAMQSVAWHLDHCRDCAADFGQWRNVQQALATLSAGAAAGGSGAAHPRGAFAGACTDDAESLAGWKVRWENSVAPFLLAGRSGAGELAGAGRDHGVPDRSVCRAGAGVGARRTAGHGDCAALPVFDVRGECGNGGRQRARR